MKTLILHSLNMRRVQTASIVLSVALSVMTLFSLGMTYGGVTAGVTANSQRAGAQFMAIPRDAASEVTDASLLFTGAPAPIYFSTETAEAIANTEGVSRATVRFYSQSLSEACCSTDTETRLVGVDWKTDWTVQPFASRDLSQGLADDQIVIGASVGADVGQQMTLLSKNYTVVEKLSPSGSDLDSSILFDIDEARRASAANNGLSYLWKKYGDANDLASCVLADIDEGTDANRLINRIEGASDVKVIQRTHVVEDAQRQLEAVFAILLAAGVIMLITTLVQLFARFYSCVWERKSELALYRAVGATNKQLRALIGGEVAIITAAGLVLGFAAGAAFYAALLAKLQAGQAFMFIGLAPVQTALLALIIIAAFALLAAAAIAMPFAQLSRLDPSLAMQQSDID